MEFLKKYESEHPKSISEHPKSISEHPKSISEHSFISGVMKYVALVFLCGILVIFILKGKFWQAKNKKTLSTMI
jgi:hypothetical protein